MCYHTKLTSDAQKLENRFNAKLEGDYTPNEHYHGFTHPFTPIITNKDTSKIILSSWGLMPSYKYDRSHQKFTLNAKIENIDSTPSYKDYTDQRCLVIVNGFYEWQWLDKAGKKKQKYLIEIENQEPFTLAGLWNDWIDKSTGEVISTYTIVTTEATGLMQEIHNSAKRMPMVLNPEEEKLWIEGKYVDPFRDVQLIAEKN